MAASTKADGVKCRNGEGVKAKRKCGENDSQQCSIGLAKK